MPKGYEKMRDKFKQEGLSEEEAKGKAARIWNAKHPNSPVTRKKHYDGARHSSGGYKARRGK